MTKAELIAALQSLPDDARILVLVDGHNLEEIKIILHPEHNAAVVEEA